MPNSSRRAEIILNTILVIIPLVFGGIIYILFRAYNLLMFSWFERINVIKSIKSIRYLITQKDLVFPEWFIYSLPNALWTFSGIIFFHFIWINNQRKEKYWWIVIFIFISILSEVFQLFKIIPGTFDLVDALFLLFSIMLSCSYIYIIQRWRKYEG